MIDSLRKLDAEIEEKVFGTPRDKIYYTVGERELITELIECYSSDIAAAWQIIDARPQGWSLYTLCDIQMNGEVWQCDLWRKDGAGMFEYVSAIAESAPLAICLAALRARPAAQETNKGGTES